MSFTDQRRQRFLQESSYQEAQAFFQRVVYGPSGLLHNLSQPEDEAGWHQALLRSLARERFELMLIRYTAGEPIESLRNQLEEVLASYERYGTRLWDETADRNEAVFAFYSLDDYCKLMQLVGLCFLLHRRDLLPRLAALQDGLDRAVGGADWIFEELLAYAPMDRHESDHLRAAKPYRDLADALSSETNDEALRDLDRFLKRWYKDLAGCGWHDTHKSDGGSQAGYYGYWSFEAGAAVILLGIEDDSSLHKYLYYPKDLVTWCRANAALSDPEAKTDIPLRCLAGQPCPRSGFWFTPAAAGKRQRFAQGDVMPDLGGAYGATIWQWDERQGEG